MSRGGYRAGAGRPFGARDRMPRKSVKLDRLKSMSPEYDTNEYLITNEARIFGGNALELMTAMYKAEQLPVRVRLYAAGKAVEFENQNGKSIEEIRAEILQELKAEGDDSLDRLVDDLKRHRAVIIELSRRKSAMVLKSGFRCRSSQITSILRWVSASSREALGAGRGHCQAAAPGKGRRGAAARRRLGLQVAGRQGRGSCRDGREGRGAVV